MITFANRKARKHVALRAKWVAKRLATYQPESILEVGCGYGLMLCELSARLQVPLTGIDFSLTQLQAARLFLTRAPRIALILGAGSDFRSPIDRLTWS